MAHPSSSEDCLLQSAKARVFAAPGADQVRLVISYTALAPVDARIELRRGGERGPLLAEATQHLTEHGTLRLAEPLGEGEAARARVARRFTVELEIAGEPGGCHRYAIRNLKPKRRA